MCKCNSDRRRNKVPEEDEQRAQEEIDKAIINAFGGDLDELDKQADEMIDRVQETLRRHDEMVSSGWEGFTPEIAEPLRAEAEQQLEHALKLKAAAQRGKRLLGYEGREDVSGG